MEEIKDILERIVALELENKNLILKQEEYEKKQTLKDLDQDIVMKKHLLTVGTTAGGIATFLTILQSILEKYLG